MTAWFRIREEYQNNKQIKPRNTASICKNLIFDKHGIFKMVREFSINDDATTK